MHRRSFLTATTLALATPALHAQPADEPLRIIIPLGPGTPSDSITRIVAAALAQQLGRSIIVDNKPGAGGVIAVAELLRAKPDSNTLMLGGISPVALNMAILKNPPYDPRRDFSPIGGMYNAFQAYMVAQSLPVNSFAAFIAYAQANPGKVSVAYYSALSQIQFAALSRLADLQFLAVPYKLTSTAYTDVMAGRVNATIVDIASALGFAKSGQVKLLAITLAQRNNLVPWLPAAAEVVPGLAFPAWSGLIGPAGMSTQTVTHLNAALNTALTQPQTIADITATAATPWPTSPEEFRAHIDQEITRWIQVARDAGIEPQ